MKSLRLISAALFAFSISSYCFGKVALEESDISLELVGDLLGSATVPSLALSKITIVKFMHEKTLRQGKKCHVRMVIDGRDKLHIE